MLVLDEALERLGSENPRWVRVVECRFFAGLSDEETADVLDVSSRSAQRDWHRARGRLRDFLDPETVERLSRSGTVIDEGRE